eukprot:COSAG01_NODE_41518_length_450_cov_1.467236_1_plen_21_part_10
MFQDSELREAHRRLIEILRSS